MPEILYFLAQDDLPQVRCAVALNERTPCRADLILAQDGNAAVRGDLAVKKNPTCPMTAVPCSTNRPSALDQMARVREILVGARAERAAGFRIRWRGCARSWPMCSKTPPRHPTVLS